MKPAQEYRYTDADRHRQLRELIAALPPLIAGVKALPEFSSLAPRYEAALLQAELLLELGFTQEQLSGLGRSVPDAFYRHKEWEPPYVQQADGTRTEPAWFVELEAKLQPVLKAANVLCELGYY